MTKNTRWTCKRCRGIVNPYQADYYIRQNIHRNSYYCSRNCVITTLEQQGLGIVAEELADKYRVAQA